MQRHSIHHRAHGVLANPEMDISFLEMPGGDVSVVNQLGLGRGIQVGGTAKNRAHFFGNRV